MRRWSFLPTLLVACCASLARSAPTSFDFKLEKDCSTSAGVFTPEGRMVRTLWSLKQMPGGNQHGVWDGRDEFGRNLPPGDYQVKVACSNATYNSVGTIGNSGVGTTMQSGTDDLIVDLKTGDIYTANNWEEAGQDFRKTDANGKHLMDAEFRVRNGTPNGWPIAVAVDGDTLYCSVFTVHEAQPGTSKTLDGGAVIRKFAADDGKPLEFPTEHGYIRVRDPYPANADAMSHQSLHSIAISGNVIVAADRESGTVYKFDKQSGKALGQFTMPHAMCVVSDDAGHLWIAHDGNKVSLVDLDGHVLATPDLPGIGEIACIRLGPNRLWVADQTAGQIHVYQISAPDKLEPVKTWGHKAALGEFGPLAIGHIQSFGVMPDGGFVLAQTYGHGSVVTRFAPDGNVDWQQVGLEFCTNGTYDQDAPTLFISTLSNAYKLLDEAQGTWKFEGCLYQGALKLEQSTGTPRILHLGNNRFYYSLTGDQVKVFRLEGNRFVPATLVGLTPRGWDEKFMGALAEKERPTHFAWHDTRGEGQFNEDALVKIKDDKTQIATFSCETDAQGNLFIPNHYDNAIYTLPMDHLDERGNPVYDWSKYHRLLAPDDTLVALRPQKACPLPDGGMYVLQQADESFYPGSQTMTPWGRATGLVWMGGWVCSKYDASGNRLYTVPLPEVSTGMDWVPDVGRTKDRGVVVGVYSAEQLYHYSPDGLMLGVLRPKHKTGWLDHNGSVSINRNPSDGMADLFAEESLSNRISWYRFDDRETRTMTIPLHKAEAAGETYSSEAQFYDGGYRTAEAALKAGHAGEAIELFEKSLPLATEREQPFVEYELGEAFDRAGKPEQAVEQWEKVVAAPNYDNVKRAELLLNISHRLSALKQYDRAIQAMRSLEELKTPEDRQYGPRAMLEIANIDASRGDMDNAFKQIDQVKAHFKTTKSPNPDMERQAYSTAANLLAREKHFDQAMSELEQSLHIPDLSDDGKAGSENQMGDLARGAGNPAQAAKHYESAARNYPQANPGSRAETALKAAELRTSLGDKDAARKLYEFVRDLPDAPADQKKVAEEKLKKLEG